MINFASHPNLKKEALNPKARLDDAAMRLSIERETRGPHRSFPGRASGSGFKCRRCYTSKTIIVAIAIVIIAITYNNNKHSHNHIGKINDQSNAEIAG